MDIYLQINYKKLTNNTNVIFITIYLLGSIFNQFKLFIKDY